MSAVFQFSAARYAAALPTGTTMRRVAGGEGVPNDDIAPAPIKGGDARSIVTRVRLGQFQNTPMPMRVTLLPMLTLSKLVQPWNACVSMIVTLLGMSILVKRVQPVNAPPPMCVTLAGITKLLLIPACGALIIIVIALL
jgi:hypothetical protein